MPIRRRLLTLAVSATALVTALALAPLGPAVAGPSTDSTTPPSTPSVQGALAELSRLANQELGYDVIPVSTAPLPPVASTPTWDQFLNLRESYLKQLSPGFVDCFQRHDSLIDPVSPIFHGCEDWHSSVEAAYSLHMEYRQTGDTSFLNTANGQIAPAGISLVPLEQVYEQTVASPLTLPGLNTDLNVIDEQPYGFSWMLLADRERELSTGKKDLRPLADYAAKEVQAWLQSQLDGGTADAKILDPTYQNYSWALLNLATWAHFTQDKTMLDFVQTAGRPLFDTALDTTCVANTDLTAPPAGAFIPPCLMRVAAAVRIYGAEATDWAKAEVPAGYPAAPYTQWGDCHSFGVNAYGAFALYEISLGTGESQLRDDAAHLIGYVVGEPSLYDSPTRATDPGYDCYGHWLGQVTVRAISTTYGADGRAADGDTEPQG